MKKQTVIIGGGISGLATLHYLNKKYAKENEAGIRLLESRAACGGTVRSIHQSECLFETGPNGFLTSKPNTQEFLKEIGLEPSIIKANQTAKKRYILYSNQLHQLPSSPGSFLKFKPLNFFQKLKAVNGLFKKTRYNEDISIFEFGKLKFGEKFSELFLDAFVKGVYGSDAREISLKAAFPQLFEMDQKHGSLFKAMKALKKERQATGNNRKGSSGQLMSLNKGMGECITRLQQLYSGQISCDAGVQAIEKQGKVFVVRTKDEAIVADELYVCTPSYVSSRLLEQVDPELCRYLAQITYSSIAVVGLLFNKQEGHNIPDGFGYLIPSINHSRVLGCLIESNIFEGRAPAGSVLLRLMISLPKGESSDQETMLQLALNEVKERFNITEAPQEVFHKQWERAIPEYSQDYLSFAEDINTRLKQHNRLYLCSNYLNGISFNDCVLNARRLTEDDREGTIE